MRFEDLPYRPCVGIVLFNRDGIALIGRRLGGPDHDALVQAWQLPQGGVDPGEEPWPAALRELREETNVRSVERLGEIADWLQYDIPPDLVGKAWNGKYRGQTQKWYAMRFVGDESEIDISRNGAQHAEFDSWRWEPLRNIPQLVVPFKRAVYERVAADFAKYAVSA